jgi:hypothetical protein
LTNIVLASYDAPAIFEESQCMAETLEDRIRERAHHLWEGNRRPRVRDEQSWRRACAMVTQSAALAKPKARKTVF